MLRVMYTGGDAIREAFDEASKETPFYSVWTGKVIIASHNSEDTESGSSKIEGMIRACEASANKDVITIKFHPGADKSGFITDKTPVVATLIVRVVPLENNGVMQEDRLPNVQYKYLLDALTNSMKDGLDPITKRLDALEAAEVETDEDDGIIGLIDKYSKLLENPVIMGLIERFTPVVMGFINGGAVADKPRLVAGVQDQNSTMADQQNNAQVLDNEQMDRLNAALNRLAVHCDLVNDLTALANLGDNNPAIFKMLLTQLRNQ